MKKLTIFFFIVNSLIVYCASSRILAYIPVPSVSHQTPFQPLWKELSLRGHQVTLLTTDPIGDPSLTNLTEIDLSFSYEVAKAHNFSEFASDESKSFKEIGKLLTDMLFDIFRSQFNSEQFQRLLNSDQQFDLVFMEAHVPMGLGLVWKYKAPFIGVVSLDAAPMFHESAGNPVHPVATPDYNFPAEDYEHLTFLERLKSFLFVHIYKWNLLNKLYPRALDFNREFFGQDVPDLLEIQNQMDMLFTYTHPLLQGIRALNPNTIPVGTGMHIKDPQPLPEDLQKFADSAKSGLIYFSLGTNVKGTLLNQTVKSEIMQAFAALPFKVLWKLDDDLALKPPKNVLIKKWIPQQDILRHPNLKLFITQGGLQSLQEAVVNGIPIVGIPFFGDQISNVQRVLKKGYGVKIDKKNITKTTLLEAISEVLGNPKYKETALEMKDLFYDQPLSSLENAVWWTEYVLRHKGAGHLKSSAVNMSFAVYYMLDVIGFLCVIGLIFMIIAKKTISMILKKVCKKYCKISKEKSS